MSVASSSAPSCKLEVRANRLGGIGRNDVHHLFLVLTDASGKEIYYRGGPTRGTLFPTIQTEWGDYTEGTIDWDPEAPKITVSEGNDTCVLQSKLEDQMREIEDAKIRYKLLGPNSNSTVTTALRNVGVTPKFPKGVLAPGAGMHIRKKSKAKKLFGRKKISAVCTPCARRQR